MAKVITNRRGGKQSKIEGQITEVPPLALLAVSKVMAEGQKRYPRERDGTPNWHKIGCLSNLDHGLEHACNFLAERNRPKRSRKKMYKELSHHAARALMALERFIEKDL